VVLVAHHDAARTGLVWDPRLLAPGARRAARTGRVPSFALPAEAALGLVAAGSLLGRRLPRLLGGAMLAAGLGLGLDVTLRETVPGASDNATGVATVLALVERLAAEPVEGTDVIALFPGCEEAGMGGMGAWLEAERPRLDPSTTLVLSLDTLGAGEPIVATSEGSAPWARYREQDLELAERGAELVEQPAPARVGLGAWTDAILAVYEGLPAISLLSMRDGAFTNYHLPSDTPGNVDWHSVRSCARLAMGTIEAWADGA
jgi:hypothetical protein